VTEPSIRKPLGVLLILGIIAVWTVIVVSLSPWIAMTWWPVQAVIYLVAGIVWILPLGPVLKWMESATSDTK
jgi:Protein of unknown function (DUF2842)